MDQRLEKKTKGESDLEPPPGCCNSSLWWSSPPADFLPAAYCLENSMHGLKYVAAPQRHLTERICWLISFVVGVAAAAYLINDVWDNYKRNPVIVSFQPMETEIKDIPFPAVTFCNMNRFPRSLYHQILREQESADYQIRAAAKIGLQLLNNMCGSSQSFAQFFKFAANRGKMDLKEGAASLNQTDIMTELIDLIRKGTIPCNQLIRLCLWSQQKVNCSELFSPVITESGKCCTFNMLPLTLLRKVSLSNISDNEPREPAPNWNPSEIHEWQKWNFTKTGFILDRQLNRPYRQKRAGIQAGLSVLLDPNVEEYFCPSTDSLGFKMALHSAVDSPPIFTQGKVVPLGKELYVSIEPMMTVADERVQGFEFSKRQCFFQSEKTLDFYHTYTLTNCYQECISKATAKSCGCAQYYMLKEQGTRICSTNPLSKDFKCANDVLKKLSRYYDSECENCDSLCTDIQYNFELTQADLQSNEILWMDPVDGNIPVWANHTMSIMHLYFAMDSFVPQVRRQLYAPVDLIANTGGLLGLCLGFSALSAVEVVYFFTLRWFWQRVRRRTVGRRIANKFVNALRKVSEKKLPKFSEPQGFSNQFFWQHASKENNNIVIQPDRSVLPILPAYSYNVPGEEHIRVIPLRESRSGYNYKAKRRVLKGTFYRGPL